MQNALAMNSDVKALLTLWLLKMGTKTQEIQTMLQLAAASRVMVAEELSLATMEEPHPAAGNVATLRCASEPNAAVVQTSTMHSDIKALLTLALIKVGVSLDDIQTTLRLAAGSRAEAAVDVEDDAPESEPVHQAPQAAAAPVSRQSMRAAHLASIPMREYAAA
jgi:hypothetical protein